MLKSLLRTQGRPLTLRNLVDLPALRKLNEKVIKDLAETKQRAAFREKLQLAVKSPSELGPDVVVPDNFSLSVKEVNLVVRASLITFMLHVEARIASSAGQGFYTIGPCGEELLSAVGLSLAPTDASALHYRHVGTAVMRQLLAGRSVEEIVLDRARGYTVSKQDPVAGGRHCAIGGSAYDFFVTSTLSSQCCPAVGRAQGVAMARALKAPSLFPKDAISFVSLGDGSANNGHFLSALNLAEYSAHHNIKCPVVFAISDNGISISLKTKGWVHEVYARAAMRKFIADGSDVNDVHNKSKAAVEYARRYRRPALLIFKNLSRRFGHAGTDRQNAYLKSGEIEMAANRNDILEFFKQAVASHSTSWADIYKEFESIQKATEAAFDMAVNEPKITSREELEATNSAPEHTAGRLDASEWEYSKIRERFQMLQQQPLKDGERKAAPEVMRKLMTQLFDEVLGGSSPAGAHAVYVGEDVRHGGYYLVTDGLAAKYPLRMHDFPPDETALVGAAWGYAQAGLAPILEIPYAKYLDCASDIFFEICATHWLTNGRERPGLMIRLQGFDKGTFGGNYHTHNSLHIPPGLDVVCYSNGQDYVRGVRYLLRQTAQAGRVCMSVDCTELLNRRHLYPERMDGFFLSSYPGSEVGGPEQEMGFDDVVLYRPNSTSKAGCGAVIKSDVAMDKIKLVVVSYGNGLPTSLIAVNNLVEHGAFAMDEVLVVDSPYLSSPPKQLELLLQELKSASPTAALVLADICKNGPAMPFSSFAVKLQDSGLLPAQWRAIGAANTYNPLGQLLTFLSPVDVEKAALVVTGKK